MEAVVPWEEEYPGICPNCGSDDTMYTDTDETKVYCNDCEYTWSE